MTAARCILQARWEHLSFRSSGLHIPISVLCPGYPSGKVLHSGVACSPCSLHGEKKCRMKQRFCMDKITVDMVFEELIQNVFRLILYVLMLYAVKSENRRVNINCT